MRYKVLITDIAKEDIKELKFFRKQAASWSGQRSETGLGKKTKGLQSLNKNCTSIVIRDSIPAIPDKCEK